jgi:hypothetical protein
MSRAAHHRSPAPERHALVAHRPGDVIAWRGTQPVTAEVFLGEVARAAAALPARSHVLNLCADRYRFALFFLAAVARGQVTLLPPSTTPNVIRSLRAFAPDAYCVGDEANPAIDLPYFEPAGEAAVAPIA